MILKKYICPYCNKEFDNCYKFGGHKTKCKNNPNYIQNIENWKDSFKNSQYKNNNNFYEVNKEQILYCQYCNKECKSLNSLKQHECRCKENPNRSKIISSFIEYNKNRKPTNQYIKAKELGLPKPEMNQETKDKIAKTWLGKQLPIEMKNKIQSTIQNKIENDEWHNNNGVKIKYKDNYFDSSWEVLFIKYLENKNIIWERPKKSFEYFWNNSIHKYYPDIYLPKYDLYIEIKGLPIERDYCKWKQFQNKLDIYDSYDLYNLGIIKNFDKRQLISDEFRNKHINLGEVV